MASKESLGGDFNRIWSASLVTNLVDGVLRLAAPLLGVTLTKDPVLISLLTAFSLLPWLLFAIPIGAFVDRIDRGYAIVLGNIIRSITVLAIALTITLDLITIWILLSAVFVFGACEVLVDTASQSTIPQLLKREDLERGNARLQTSEVIVSQFLGTPVSGFLYAIAIALPFYLSGFGFIVAAAIIALVPFQSSLKAVPTSALSVRKSFFAEIKFGIRYMYQDKRIFHIVVITTSLGFFFSLSNAIAPLFIIEELEVEPQYFGLLFAIQGVGALVGSIVAPRVSRGLGRGRALAYNLALASLPIFFIGLAPNVWVFLPLTIVIGFTISIWNILLMSLYQSFIPAELFGRIHGARRSIVWGLMPIGAVLGGFIAKGGLRLPFLIGGALSILIVAISFKTIIRIGDESAEIVPKNDLSP